MYASDGAMIIPLLWCSCAPFPGNAAKSGNSESATFMRNVPEPQRYAAMRARKSASTCSGSTRRSNRSFGFTLATMRAPSITVPSASSTPAARPALTITRATGGIRPQFDAARGALLRHRLRNGPHAAPRMAPLARLAVHFAEDVMQQNVRRPLRIRTGEIAYYRIEAERRLDRRALEPAVEHVAGALGEQIQDVAAFRQGHAHESAC